MPNYVGSGPGGSIQPGVDPWTPVQGEQVRLDLNDHEDGLADHETRIDALEISSGGDVDGPASAVDNALPRFDGTTGKLLQGSGIVVGDGAVGSIDGNNTGDVTLVNTAANYLTLAAQVLTTALVNLASHVTGRLPYANLTAATAASRLLARGSASGAGDWQEVNLGANLQMVGTTLSASGGGGGTLDDLTDVVITTPTSGQLVKYDGANWVNAAVDDDSIANAKLANMATQTIKGRTTAGTGDPEDLTATQATAILNNFVGDSGSGGTKGLAPAPAAGDAAANKFLKASGAWDVPSGTGAPTTSQYVTLALDAGLSAERVLTGTTNQIAIADGGANGNVTLSTPQNIHTAATPQFARLGLGNAADADDVLKMTGQYGSRTFDAGNSGTTLTLNWNNGNTQLVTLTGNCTFTLSNPKDGYRYLIILEQDGTGTRTVTWPSSVKWPAGTAPTLSTTAGKVDIVTLVWVAGIGASGNYIAAANLNYTPA